MHTPFVLDRDRVGLAPLAAVGAKALTLARLAGAGMPVPDFFVVTAGAFAVHRRAAEISAPLEGDDERLRALGGRIRDTPVDRSVASPVLVAYRRLCAGAGRDHVAVRSSGGAEDSAEASFAGQFSSILGVAGEERLLDALRRCWASSVSEGSLRYRAVGGRTVDGSFDFGVVVQIQVFAQKAGVLFTVHPLDPAGGCSYLEANFGSCESVTAGLVNPDAMEISRAGPAVVDTRIGTKRRMTTLAPDAGGTRVVEIDEARRQAAVLTEAEAVAVATAGLEIETMLGAPQDIEWAIDAIGLWILQSRPVTASRVA